MGKGKQQAAAPANDVSRKFHSFQEYLQGHQADLLANKTKFVQTKIKKNPRLLLELS